MLHQFFMERCRANIHVLLVMEQQEQALQVAVMMMAVGPLFPWDHTVIVITLSI